MKSCRSRGALLALAIAALCAIGFGSLASVALAQGAQREQTESSAAASQPASVGGVVVQAPPKLDRMPPDKRAAFDAEAAKREAWQRYRRTASPAPAVAAAGVDASARVENYPGLRGMASH